jgi:hypothetical protein
VNRFGGDEIFPSSPSKVEGKMKRMMAIIGIVVSLVILCPAVVLASDPPDADTDVDVVVVTPGDVDLDVDVVAGGDVDVTIDGTNINSTLGGINYNLGLLGGDIAWVEYHLSLTQKSLDELWETYNAGVPLTQTQIDSLKSTTKLLSDAVAILIIKINQARLDIDNNYSAALKSLNDLQSSIDTLNKEIDGVNVRWDNLAVEFGTFVNDTRANIANLAGAINKLGSQLDEQEVRANHILNVAIGAVAVGGVALILGIVLVVKSLLQKPKN